MRVFSIISSDRPALHRIGEVITRIWQTAYKMRQQRGRLAGDNDNARVEFHIAKHTIDPAV